MAMIVKRSFIAVLGAFFLLSLSVLFGINYLPSSTDSPAEASSDIWPTNGWTTAEPSSVGMDEEKLEEARNYAIEEGGGSGIITRGGKIVMSWGDISEGYRLRSTTKSIGVTALGLAIKDGLISLSDRAQQHLSSIGIPPSSNAEMAEDITILQLATHTAGFDTSGGFTELQFEPGTMWHYSDGGANWLADVITATYHEDIKDLLFDRVFGPLGISSSDLTWRDNQYRPETLDGVKRREFGSATEASVDAMARIGYLYLRQGEWDGEEIIPQSFVQQARQPLEEVEDLPLYDSERWPDAPRHYGLLWWNNGDCRLPEVPSDMYTSWGADESFIIVIPSLDIVAARAGSGWRNDDDNDFYDSIEPFLNAIVESVDEDFACE
jgi:CubicO group peptidase (beta-lactamase class C family)